MASGFSVEALDIFLALKEKHLGFPEKNIFPPLESKLLVMWEGTSEAPQIVFEVLHTV
jgi:hypothetical protein